MTISEHILRLKAYQLKEVDSLKRIHQQAWANNVVKSTTKAGKPRYKRFGKFFDYEKAIAKILKKRNDKEKTSNSIRDLVIKNNREGRK